MAGAHCAITSFLTPHAITTATTTSRTAIAKKLLVATSSSISAPFPSKLAKRRNYLRPKILKTLTKPYPNITTTPIILEESSTIPIIPLETDETPHENDVVLPSEEYTGESHPATDGEIEKGLEAYETSGSVAVAGVSDGGVGKFSTRSVLKFGMYLVGIFVFQTICAVWILGSADSDKKHENSESGTKIRDLETSRKKLFLNGNGNLLQANSGLKPGGFGYMDELELEAKIVEIRAMAREARKIERRERKNSGLVSDFDDVEDVNESASVEVRSGIEKEVDARLVKLKKRLNSAQGKSLGSPVGYLSKSGKVEDRVKNESLDAKELNDALFFEKKHKFRSQSTKPRNDAKGFQGTDDRSGFNKKKSSPAVMDAMRGSGSIGRNGSELVDQGKQLDFSDGNLQGEGAGVVQDTSHGGHTGANKLRESSELERQNSFSIGKENQAGSARSDKHTVLSRYGSSKRREVGSKPVGNDVRDKQSQTNNDLWWLKLPYVLAILLRRSSDPEGPGGLYTLKSSPASSDQSNSSYTVAFEDQGDANNFCYLLESFFEDLGDFSADIVPLSTKELQEAVQSCTMKLIAVKKGQLQLYAGQPLADVEMDLRSLAE